jgi:predicted RNA-binding protein with PUA-like domain
VYSFNDLLREGEGIWDGVRNYQARNNLAAMKPGDEGLFYHSNLGKEVVGLMRIVSDPFPENGFPDGPWVAVRVKPIRPLRQSVSLARMRRHPDLHDLALIRHSRLSVIPLTELHFHTILALENEENLEEPAFLDGSSIMQGKGASTAPGKGASTAPGQRASTAPGKGASTAPSHRASTAPVKSTTR